MGPSTYIGRVGGLAAALGVGLAVFTAPAAAWAGPDSGASADTSASADSSASPSSPVRRGSQTGQSNAAQRSPRSAPQSGSPADSSAALETPAVDPAEVTVTPRRNRGATAGLPAPAAATKTVPATAAPAASTVAVTVPAAASLSAPAASLPGKPLQSLLANLPALASLPVFNGGLNPGGLTPAPHLGPVLASVADHLSTAINNAVTRIVQSLANGSPFGPKFESPLNWLIMAFTQRKLQPAATDLLTTQSATPTPVLVLNGYNIVPTSDLYSTSFYGPYTSWPGYKGIQGAQDFALVDPANGQTVGSFSALTLTDTTGAPGKGAKLIVVTSVQDGTVGTTAGKVPPVGSVLAVSGGNGVTSGNVYTDMPDGQGDYVRQYYAITRFGNLPLFTRYHAALTLTDYQSANEPVGLTDGYYLAPTVPSSEIFTAANGLPPLFMVMQGTQEYSVFNQDTQQPTGSFQALLTTTSDFFGIATKMIRVTDTGDQTNIGTAPGQVPPVGTVYNVVYFNKGKYYLLYESAPMPSGDQVSVKLVLGDKVIPLNFLKFNAATAPTMKPVTLPDGGGTFGLKFVPSSPETQPVGVNGLPPREMITQAYQQFDVYNSDGTKIGNVDAYITRQWDLIGGTQSQIMVINVNEGTPGTEYNQVPAVGSVFSEQNYGILGLSVIYSARPTPAGDYVVEWLKTPLGNLPLSGEGSAAADPNTTVFFDPFKNTLVV
jgi:hypothetical protein